MMKLIMCMLIVLAGTIFTVTNHNIAIADSHVNSAYKTVSSASFDDGLITSDQKVNVFLDGKQIIFEVPPVVVQGRTLVAMREIFELLEADINWDHASQTATAKRNNQEVVIVRDSNTAFVDGKAVTLDVAARTVNSRMMVPLRFVSETLGMEVQWTEKEQRIDLFSTAGNQGAGNTGSDGSISENGKSIITGRMSFGLSAPRGLSFTKEDYFLDNVSSVFYNLVLDLRETSQQELTIRAIVWHPNGNILLDRTENQVQVATDSKEFRTHGEIKLAEVSQRFPDKTNANRWDNGSYKVDIWLNEQRLLTEHFTVINAINTVGNTSANLYNKGLVTQQGNLIYYVGDDGALYKQEIGSSDVVKLIDDNALYLNSQGQWVYFVNTSRDNVISKIRFDGRIEPTADSPYYVRKGEAETLNHDEAGQLLLVGDWLYYVNKSDKQKLYRMKLDGTNKQLVIDEPIHNFYIANSTIVYQTYVEHYRIYSQRRYNDNYGSNNRQQQHLITDNDFVLGNLYGAELVKSGDNIQLKNRQQLLDEQIVGMIVSDQWVYYLKPKGNSWDSRVSGRVPAQLYRMPITPLTNSAASFASLVVDQDVMNFYVDSKYLIVQDNLNRGRVWYRYTPDGKLIDELSTQVTRKYYGVVDNVMLHNRTTFPITYMNGAYQGIYYYVGNEDERIFDELPYRNDRMVSMEDRGTRELRQNKDE